MGVNEAQHEAYRHSFSIVYYSDGTNGIYNASICKL